MADFAAALAEHLSATVALASVPKHLEPSGRLVEREARAFATLMETPAPDVGGALRKLDALGDWIVSLGGPDAPVLEGGAVNHGAALERVRRDFHRLLEPPAPDPDAELLALGPEFESRWAEELVVSHRCANLSLRDSQVAALDRELDAATERTGEIAHRIARMPAQTLAGFRLKARAIAWGFGDARDLAEDELADKGTYGDFIRLMLGDLLGVAVNIPVPGSSSEAGGVTLVRAR